MLVHFHWLARGGPHSPFFLVWFKCPCPYRKTGRPGILLLNITGCQQRRLPAEKIVLTAASQVLLMGYTPKHAWARQMASKTEAHEDFISSSLTEVLLPCCLNVLCPCADVDVTSNNSHSLLAQNFLDLGLSKSIILSIRSSSYTYILQCLALSRVTG